MPQLQAQVPGPLGDDLPGFLPPGRVATPAVGILLAVFVLQGCFKGTAVQIEGNDIRSGKGALGKIGPEEFIDDAVADEPDPTLLLLLGSGVGGHNDANKRLAL